MFDIIFTARVITRWLIGDDMTAYCKVCGKPIYNSEGTVDKKGFWTCKKCNGTA